MARIHSIAQDAVLVAIDISKKRNDVLIQMPGSPRRRRLVVLNQRAEHDRFIQRLKAFDRPVVTGFEATGNYHRALAWRLVDAGIETRLISSMALARQREAIHNGWDKNDPKDAQVILHMLATGLSQVYQDPLAAGGPGSLLQPQACLDFGAPVHADLWCIKGPHTSRAP